jgi:signal peptidase
MKQNKRLSLVKRITKIIMVILAVIISVYGVSITIQKLTSPDKTPTFLGYKTFVVLSGSMEPNLNIGDIIIVKQVKDNKLKVGDVVSYKNSNTVTTHRIIDISTKGEEIFYKTKGDANNIEDDKLVEGKNIEGKLVTSIPKIGNLSILLNNRTTIIAIVIIVFGYLTLSNNKTQEIEEDEEII